jgi:hypothetical protein
VASLAACLKVTYMRTNELIVNVHVPDAVLSVMVAFYGGIAALPQLAEFKIGKMRRQERGLANDAPVR